MLAALQRRPMVLPALMCAAGICLGSTIIIPLWCFPCALPVIALTARAAGRKGAIPCLALLFFLMGIFYVSVFTARLRHNPLKAFEERYISLGGTVEDREDDENSSVLRLKVRRIGTAQASRPVGGGFKVIVTVKEGLKSAAIHPGDVLEVRGTLEALHRNVNPGIFNSEQGLARQFVTHRMVIHRGTSLRKAGGCRHFSCIHGASFIKGALEKALSSHHDRERAQLLCGIVFGDRSRLSDPDMKAFKDTGTLHILAASGMNVGILLASVLFLLKRCGLNESRGGLVALPLIILYTFMAGASASIVRASMMISLAILAKTADRDHDLCNSLCAAGLVMLLMNPFTLFDIGFQLSFGALAGILLFAPLIERLAALLPPWGRSAAELFLVSLGVQLVLGPLLAWHFSSLSLCAPLCNVFAVPPAGVLLYLGLLEGIMGALCDPLAWPLAGINGLLMAFMLACIRFFSSLPACALVVPRPSPALCTFYYLIMVLMVHCITEGRLPHLFRRKELWCGALGLLVMACLFRPCAKPGLLLTVLDVGEGDSIWLSLPGGEHVLIDGGPRSAREGKVYDAGERIVLPVLRSFGVGRLDLMMLSHPHDDHCGGLAALAKGMAPRTFREGCPSSANRNYLELRSLLVSRNVNIQRVKGEERVAFSSGVTLRIFPPLVLREEVADLEANEASMVVQVLYQKTRMLLMGDLDREGERRLMERYGDLRSDIIKIGHHGSATSSSEDFIDAVSPRYAVMSLGAKNIHGHPAPRVLAALRKRHIRTFRTDVHGAVIFSVRDGRIEARTMREEK
jgi:competence protein ComEC